MGSFWSLLYIPIGMYLVIDVVKKISANFYFILFFQVLKFKNINFFTGTTSRL